ncbi:MAG: adenylate/guanylate cyclase domain-containing protein [Variovorax sp.]
MRTEPTVVFADLSGSTHVFEAIGNARATETVTTLVQWVGRVCEAYGGRVVKTLGDGIFALFPDGSTAINAVVRIQRAHQKRLLEWAEPMRMELQIGIASGSVVEVGGDCFGDAVNLASRLSQLAGPGQIWATASVIDQICDGEVRHRNLGLITIRGKTETPIVHRVDWQEEATSFMTVPAQLNNAPKEKPRGSDAQIELAWLDIKSSFKLIDLPIQLGRVSNASFVINDPRVSRLHARIEARQGSCVLVDTSTYGTWVRFHGATGFSHELPLRREECVLHGSGELGLGAPLSDVTSPTIWFSTQAMPVLA